MSLNQRDRDEIAKNAKALLRSSTHIGPATCCVLLELWLTRKFEITEEDFDNLVGILHEHLEKAYDERWRFGNKEPRDYNADEDTNTEPGGEAF